MNKLEMINVTKSYKHKNANENINLVLESGVYGLLGPNGAGKSTLMKQIVTVTNPTSGKILYNGKDIKSLDDEYRAIVGYLPQDFDAYKNFKAKDFLMYMAALKGMDKETSKKRVDELLKLVGLSEVSNKLVSKFSGGMKRRLNIGCAIAHSPKLIIMDEPTVGIDPQSRNHILESVLKLREEGSTVIYTSHYMQEVDDICDRIAIIDKGKIIAEGTSEELKNLVSKNNTFKFTLAREIKGLKDQILLMEGVNKVIYENNEYTVSTDKNVNLVSKIVECVVNNNGIIRNITNEEPSLENVFLSLTGKTLRE